MVCAGGRVGVGTPLGTPALSSSLKCCPADNERGILSGLSNLGSESPMADSVVYVVDDDDDDVRRALCRALASADLYTGEFASADAFLQQPLTDQPSCLVLDLCLGKGRLGGLALQAELADRKPRIPIIFITGTGDVRASVRAMKAGAFDVLEKPVDPDSLIAAVRGALALSRQSRTAQVERQIVDLVPSTPRQRMERRRAYAVSARLRAEERRRSVLRRRRSAETLVYRAGRVRRGAARLPTVAQEV
jgi:FixJ family two-component response regulator